MKPLTCLRCGIAMCVPTQADRLALTKRLQDALIVTMPKILWTPRESPFGAHFEGSEEAALQKVRQSVADFLTGDCAWFEETPFVRVEQFGGDLDPSRSMGQIESLDGAIKSVGLLQFLNLGTTPTGSRSVGEVHRDLWITRRR